MKEIFDEAAKDQNKPEYWLKKLFENYARENDYGRQEIEEHLLEYGDAVYPIVKEYIFSLTSQYHNFTAPITEIRYTTDEGRRTKAIIDTFTNGMEYGIIFLGKFKHPNRIQDIGNFYDNIKENTYSDPESGFGDCFNAVKIRQYAVCAMGIATDQHDPTVSFYVKTLKDPSKFVRWEAIDNLYKQWKPEEVSRCSALLQALKEASKQEDNSVSNRKKKLAFLLNVEKIE